MSKYKVHDYQTGEELDCEPTAELIRESLAEKTGTGAVGAFLAGGEWRWLDAGDPAPCGAEDCRTVYVVEVSSLNRWRIISSEGVDMGTYEADSPEAALDVMARAAGYRDQADAAAQVGPFTGTVVEVSE